MGIEVDGANQKLILDSDGDTYIEGATDDTLKVYVSGAQDFTITANTLTAESGSTIAAQALTATTVTASGIVKTDDATEATSTTDGSLQTDGGLSVVKDAVFGDDIKLLSDASVIHFGTNSEVTLTHSHDSGILLKHTATADDKPINLVLQTGETDMAADDVIGKISFQAPDEGTGTDAILVSGAIQAVAEGDHSSSSNATRLEFMTGSSEAATSKMSFSSAALLTVTDAPPKIKILPTTNGNSGVVEICGRSTDGSPTENRTQIKGEPEGSTANTRMTFHTENASGVNEVMRINSSGKIGIGTTTIGAKLVVADNVEDFVARFTNDGDDANRDGIYIQGGHDNGSGTTSYLVVADGDGNSTGELQTSSGTFQLTDTSDSRLKQNIVDTSINGIDSIKSLKVRDFAYKKNPTETIVGGFVAQELKEVYPQAVSEGRTEEKILSVSRERLVPLLTKGLQEAITKIETLETEITALKSRVTTLEG